MGERVEEAHELGSTHALGSRHAGNVRGSRLILVGTVGVMQGYGFVCQHVFFLPNAILIMVVSFGPFLLRIKSPTVTGRGSLGVCHPRKHSGSWTPIKFRGFGVECLQGIAFSNTRQQHC